MKAIKILVFLIAIALGNTAHASSNHVQYDSLRIKISQMLIFGIQDEQKVMEADSMLEAYADRHLGGVIIFGSSTYVAYRERQAGSKHSDSIKVLE